MNRHRLTPMALIAAATALSCSGNDGPGGFTGVGGTSTADSGGAPSTLGGATSGGATSGVGGSQVGGASVGGSQTGGANTGGVTNVGGSQTGGANTGGVTNVGGSQTGGANTGGAANVGGSQTGGANTGGAANVGGNATGGKATGGAANVGGNATGGATSAGGAATGGNTNIGGGGPTGGRTTGGRATGGAATGGSATGGAASVGGSTTGGVSSTCPEGNTNLCGMLAAHNAARAAVSPAPSTPLPAMTWDATVAAAAQSWADQCNFSHYTAGTYGQNLYASAGGGYPSAQSVVDDWVSEVADYNYANNTCSGVCGHYTQVVWRTSINLGCGVKYCTTNSPFSGFANWYIVVCNYLPPGNYTGQKPY